ncbi:MAG: type II and III secretion system protein [Acidobacteria bacterium]|nr:type II and III secretion system protein [Acidobacteriota bacterium]
MKQRWMAGLLLAAPFVMPQGRAGNEVPAAKSEAVGGELRDLRVTLGKSLVIDYPSDIARISTSDPLIVDAVPATAREFLLHGKGHGSATVVVWSKSGDRTLFNVNVEFNLEPLRRLMKQTFPDEQIEVLAGRDSVSLTGLVGSKEVADRALALAAPLAKSVVSNLQLRTSPSERQVLLRVKFAELNRNAANSVGFNLLGTGAGGTIGRVTTQQFSAPALSRIEGRVSEFTFSDVLNVFAFRPDLNLGAFVKALQAQGVLQILAEPNLVATAGKEASFLVGGEFPVPIVQGGANAGAVTIQFREYGIRLSFKPALTGPRTVQMYVKPEVSTIDLANAVSLQGFTIPALSTRRMETNIELMEGQSFVIGGLIDDRVTENMSKIPGLANIPVLGPLFKSRSENKTRTELIVIVTPEIAQPLAAGEAPPLPVMPRQFLVPWTPEEVERAVKQARPGKAAVSTKKKQGKEERRGTETNPGR